MSRFRLWTVRIRCKIPPATQPGKVFKLKGKGVPHLRRKDHRGDQLVIVNVEIPAKLTKEQRELFEKLGARPSARQCGPRRRAFWIG